MQASDKQGFPQPHIGRPADRRGERFAVRHSDSFGEGLIEHLVDFVSVESPLSSDLYAWQSSLLSTPIDCDFFHLQIFGHFFDCHDIGHGKPPSRDNAGSFVQ